MPITEKKDNQFNYPTFGEKNNSNNEIDLAKLFSVIYSAKKMIILIMLAFGLIAVLSLFFLPKKWTSIAIITSPETENTMGLNHAIMKLDSLGVNADISSAKVYNQFLKKFDSQITREEFLSKSPYISALVKDNDENNLYGTIFNVAENFVAKDNRNPKQSENVPTPYNSWTLSFSARTAEDAQSMLRDYIGFVSDQVNKDVLTSIKLAIDLKINTLKNTLDLERVDLENQHNINLKRLGYSLQVANAAGLKDPVYSNGQTIKDDPDYSVSLGSNGISEKLKIENSIKDIAELNASIQNRQHILSILESVNYDAIVFTPYSFQMQPSLPLKSDGPRSILIIALSLVFGFMLAVGIALFRSFVSTHKTSNSIL